MTNPKDAALRQAREVIATNRDAFVEANIPEVNYGPIWDSYEKSLKRYDAALTSIDAVLAGEGAAGDVRERVREAIETEFDALSPPDWGAIADAALSAIPTPAVVRPEDVSNKAYSLLIGYGASVASETISIPEHQFINMMRHFAAWAMTRRAPVSDAAVVAQEIANLRALVTRLTNVAADLAGELSDPGTEALAAIHCGRNFIYG